MCGVASECDPAAGIGPGGWTPLRELANESRRFIVQFESGSVKGLAEVCGLILDNLDRIGGRVILRLSAPDPRDVKHPIRGIVWVLSVFRYSSKNQAVSDCIGHRAWQGQGLGREQGAIYLRMLRRPWNDTP